MCVELCLFLLFLAQMVCVVLCVACVLCVRLATTTSQATTAQTTTAQTTTSQAATSSSQAECISCIWHQVDNSYALSLTHTHTHTHYIYIYIYINLSLLFSFYTMIYVYIPCALAAQVSSFFRIDEEALAPVHFQTNKEANTYTIYIYMYIIILTLINYNSQCLFDSCLQTFGYVCMWSSVILVYVCIHVYMYLHVCVCVLASDCLCDQRTVLREITVRQVGCHVSKFFRLTRRRRRTIWRRRRRRTIWRRRRRRGNNPPLTILIS